jgi:hypothetical protein
MKFLQLVGFTAMIGLALAPATVQATAFNLGFNTDATGNAGLTNVNAEQTTSGGRWGANDGNYPSGKNFYVGGDPTPTWIGTGSSVLSSDRIVAGTYTINFQYNNNIGSVTTSNLTAQANYVVDATITSLGNLGGLTSSATPTGWGPSSYFSYSFTVADGAAAVGNYLQLTFVATSDSYWKGLAYISASYVGSSTDVPEPASMALLGLGLVGLGLARRVSAARRQEGEALLED